MRVILSVLILIIAVRTALADDPPRPKYAATTLRLSHDHDFIRRCPAPDFWALMPYYAAQPDDQSCSAASVAMLVNALRSGRELAADEQLATPSSVVSTVEPSRWRDKLAPGGPGVALDELGALIPIVLQAFDVTDVEVQVLQFDDNTRDSRTRLTRLLAENERSSRDMIIVNFLQSALTGDPEGDVGHMAPVGAYDAARGRVLVLDPDRRWYEPYWVPVETLLQGMTIQDPEAGQSRGLLRIVMKQARIHSAPRI